MPLRGCGPFVVVISRLVHIMSYLVVVLEDLSIGQLADQFVTTDREEAMAWAQDPSAIVEVLLED
jgi:hypothetical protein